MELINTLVKLRPIVLSDAGRYVKWFSDAEVVKYVEQQQITIAQERVWITRTAKLKAAKIFAIETIDGVHIGSIGLRHIHKQNRTAEYAIMIGEKQFWGKGYGTAASKLILAYGFKTLKLNRIFLNVYEFNKRGILLYHKLGFKKEGVHRQYVRRGNTYYDAILMGLLVTEWKKLTN